MISKSLVSAVVIFGGIQLARATNQLSVSYTDSLSDCKAFADNLEATYYAHYQGSSVLQKVYPYSTPYELVQCDFAGMCPDNTKRNTCYWQRFLGVFCDITQNTVTFSIATNSLPNHCYYALNNQPIGASDSFDYYRWDMQYNIRVDEMDASNYPDSDGNVYATSLTTQTDLNNQLCEPNWGKTARIDKNIGVAEYIGTDHDILFNNLGSSSTTIEWTINPVNNVGYTLLDMPVSDEIVGISRNGVFFFAGTSHLGYDAFYPKAYGTKQNPQALDFDVCLGTSITHSTYRYHSYSPCLYDTGLRNKAQLCSSDKNCTADKFQYADQNTPTSLKDISPIGIAKDGHIIYGPYKANKQLWQPCDVDVCNGRYFTSSYYGYVATMFHPYIISCWGPGNKIINSQGAIIAAQCTTHPRVCYLMDSSATYLTSVLAFGIAALISLFAI